MRSEIVPDRSISKIDGGGTFVNDFPSPKRYWLVEQPCGRVDRKDEVGLSKDYYY